ncbi:hypothetical protein [Roseateles sp. LYH14W]|uniref:Uncharacterized protein n=1 Tax=Pelomonas parva TaxID=3299032 RepID=A0ABW7F0G6_9BURK
MGLLTRLFRSKPPEVPLFEHPVLGSFKYDATTQEWETVDSAPVYHGGLSGSAIEPDPAKLAEVLQRMSNLAQYWRACESDLRYIAGCYSSLPSDAAPESLFRVAALSLYKGYWEVCFETIKPHRWLYIGMQFEGECLVSNTIDS